MAHLIGIQLCQRRTRRRRAEGRPEAMRHVTERAEIHRVQRDVEPRTDVVPERHRTQKIRAVAAFALTHRH